MKILTKIANCNIKKSWVDYPLRYNENKGRQKIMTQEMDSATAKTVGKPQVTQKYRNRNGRQWKCD
jgi:hypothetical protein